MVRSLDSKGTDRGTLQDLSSVVQRKWRQRGHGLYPDRVTDDDT